jgi:hypothetical protein
MVSGIATHEPARFVDVAWAPFEEIKITLSVQATEFIFIEIIHGVLFRLSRHTAAGTTKRPMNRSETPHGYEFRGHAAPTQDRPKGGTPNMKRDTAFQRAVFRTTPASPVVF